MPEGGTELLKQLYDDGQWVPEYASADTTIALTNAVQTNTQAVLGLTSALTRSATDSQVNEVKTIKAVEDLNETTANTNTEISDNVVMGTQIQSQIASNSLAEAVTNTAQNNIANQHLARIDTSEQLQSLRTSVSGVGGGGGVSGGGFSSFDGGLSSSTSIGLPHASGGILTSIGSMLSNLVDPIYDILESIVGDVSNFLNSGLFSRPLGMLNSIMGSSAVQLGGSIFAISSFINGDRKEQLLSMIFFELQLMYQELSMIRANSMFFSNAALGHATGGYITGPGTGTSDSIPARLSNGEFVIRSEAVKRYGTNFLNAVNDGTFARIHTKVPRFADGGLVKEATNNVGNNMAKSMGGVIGQHISNTATFNVALVRDEQEAMASFMRSSHGQRIMLDFSKKYANVTRSF